MASGEPQERPDRTPTQEGNGFARAQDRVPAPAEATELDGAIGPPNWRADQIREWLLLILRFAVTRDVRDQMGVFGKADELDALGLQWRPSAPSFFCRTSNEICNAITMPGGPIRTAILKRHLARIDDVRLRRALQAAITIEDGARRYSRSKRPGLWDGLPR